MEIALSGVIKNFTLKEKVFDCAGRLACRALWLLFLLESKRVHKSAVTNTQSRYCYLFFSRFSEGWSLIGTRDYFLGFINNVGN